MYVATSWPATQSGPHGRLHEKSVVTSTEMPQSDRPPLLPITDTDNWKLPGGPAATVTLAPVAGPLIAALPLTDQEKTGAGRSVLAV